MQIVESMTRSEAQAKADSLVGECGQIGCQHDGYDRGV